MLLIDTVGETPQEVLPAIQVVYLSKNGCSICRIYKRIFLGAMEQRTHWGHEVIMLYSPSEIAMYKQIYGLGDLVPFMVVKKNDNVIGTIEGAKLRVAELLETIDKMVM